MLKEAYKVYVKFSCQREFSRKYKSKNQILGTKTKEDSRYEENVNLRWLFSYKENLTFHNSV